MLGTARVLRAQGELPEALQAAQQVYGEDPANAEAYREAEAAMIGMDRFQGVLQLDEQAAKLGVTPEEARWRRHIWVATSRRWSGRPLRFIRLLLGRSRGRSRTDSWQTTVFRWTMT